MSGSLDSWHFADLWRRSRLSLASIILMVVAVVVSFGSFVPWQNIARAQAEGICGRSSTVQRAILIRVEAETCGDVTDADLASIEFLYLNFRSGGMSAGDLDGLSGVMWLILRGSNIIPFPADVFKDLTSIEYFHVNDGAVTTLPVDTFLGLSSLDRLSLHLSEITTIDDGAFNGLTSLESISLTANSLTAIGENTFSPLGVSADFDTLRISGDEIATIAPNAFDDLTNLDYLRIRADAVETIQVNTFAGLGNITWLIFDGESVTTIESGAFSGVGEAIDDTMREVDEDGYTVIFLTLDALETLQATTFSGLPKLERLAISGDELATLQPDVFDGLDSLDVLYIDAGELSTIDASVFDDFPTGHELHTLRLNRGAKEILAAGVIVGIPMIEAIDIWDETMTTIGPNWFNGVMGLERLLFDDAGNISRVERGAFNGLTELTKLVLSDNKITVLPDDIFDGLEMLEILELGGNPLTRLPAGLILNPPCLETFDFSGQGFSRIPIVIVGGVEHSILANLPRPNVGNCGPDGGIKHLILDGIPMTQRDLDLIPQYTTIETLSLADTGINAAQALNVRTDRDFVNLKSLDLSGNDMSALNQPAFRVATAAIISRMTGLEELYLANTRIDGDTALAIIQNINPDIKELSLAGNNLADWNHPALEDELKAAWSRLSERWILIDLSDTALNSQGAGAIVPYIERTHDGVSEEVIEELDDPDLRDDVILDLSGNYLSYFGSGWLRNWEFVDIVDLSCNEITSVRPEWFLSVSNHLRWLLVHGNPLDDREEIRDQFDAVLPDVFLRTFSFRPCERSNFSVPKSVARVLRLENTIRSIAINPGRTVRLEVDVYGRQDIVDNSLADRVFIIWDDENAGGTFAGTGNLVEYTAPEAPGNYSITARVASEQCFGDFEQCTARFGLKVNRRPATIDVQAVPVNPAGQIPTILTGDDGTAHEVFTPVEGGRFVGDGFSLTAPPGAVADGEFIGVSVMIAGPASNVGEMHHRYSLGGNWYRVGVVDGDGRLISDYRLNQPAEVCVPLPPALRGNVDDVAVVAMEYRDGGFTVLTSRLRLESDGSTLVCGGLSQLPADVAVAKRGAPSALPSSDVVGGDEFLLPETGGSSLPVWAMIVLTLWGFGVVLVGVRSYWFRNVGRNQRPSSSESIARARN